MPNAKYYPLFIASLLFQLTYAATALIAVVTNKIAEIDVSVNMNNRYYKVNSHDPWIWHTVKYRYYSLGVDHENHSQCSK
jgi:hypothetical protein